MNIVLPCLLLVIVRQVYMDELCLMNCVCIRNAQKDHSNYMKIKCEKLTELDEHELQNIAGEILQLNLSNNQLTTFAPKVQLIALQKLDLSKNRLTSLEKDQFLEIPNLRRLDLSGNNIKDINLYTFTNLKKLERLKLNHNQINSITLGTFDPLISLKQLDISFNPLTCDCSLLWLLDWSVNKSVKLVSNPKCNSPLKGAFLRKIKINEDIQCSNKIPWIIDLKPSKNQIVFEGDSLTLQCKAAVITDSFEETPKVEWKWFDLNPKTNFPEIRIQNQFLTGLIDSTLRIYNISKNHTGLWDCLYSSRQGNHSRGISIVVISNETQYCPMVVTKNNKGTYMWPRTIVNYTASVSCEFIHQSMSISEQRAHYFCSEDGEWTNLNTSACSYISETTRVLEQFSKVNSSILESAKHFRDYTSNLRIFRDVMDFAYAVQTIENYMYIFPNEQLGGIFIDVVNNFMDLPKVYISGANVVDNSSLKLIKATEILAEITQSSPQLHKSKIALEMFPVKRDGFKGIKCSWYLNAENHLDRLFSCVTNSQAETSLLPGKVIEASITLPETLFDELLFNKAYKILISMHASSKLFPLMGDKEDVISAVVGAKLVDTVLTNLTDPIFVMMRTPSTSLFEVKPFVPVWWNPELRNGSGGWSSENCQFNDELQDYLVFSCYQFSYYGLLQDISHLRNQEYVSVFKMLHPALYVGAFILFVCFLITILTYLLCYTLIQMPKKAKHSLINLWISVCFLLFMYIFGINQTENVQMCQVIGMLLHYFSLSSLLWICVGVNCMYKRLSKHDVIELQDDELPSEQPVQKPILGLYFVGWGIAAIICGLSAAINMKEYASPTHCFLRSGPELSALYIPFTILLVFLGIFCLLIRCTLYNLDSNGHLSEGTQATENVDLDLLESNFTNAESRSIHSTSTKTTSSEMEDQEHGPSTQLKAYIIFLFLLILTWLSCAFATVQPLHLGFYEEDLFSVISLIFFSMLGFFTVFFFCIARSDVRTQWAKFFRWLKKEHPCFRSRSLLDTMPNVSPIQIQPLPLPPVPNTAVNDVQIQVTSRSSSRSSNNTKSNSNNSNILKVAMDLNGSFIEKGSKVNNVNLIVLHRQQYRTHTIPNIIENPTNAADVFYNPHQSTVARKFFRRQKKHMMKRNNLTGRPRDRYSDTGSAISEPKCKKDNVAVENSIFGAKSKVNNTNIHVEHVRKVQRKNPNLFSDSADDYDSPSNVPMETLFINAEHLRKREVQRHRTRKKSNNGSKSQSMENNMRSVSQQCTLEYSSENISDSILDSSPQKLLTHPLNVNEATLNNSPMQGSLVDDNMYTNVNKDIEQLPTTTNADGGSANTSAITTPRIYINPSHDLLFAKPVNSSRTSSVSVSDLDELYQQIRRGPKAKPSYSNVCVNNYNSIHHSPCLSDSEIHSYVSEIRYRRRRNASSNDNLSDIETTV